MSSSLAPGADKSDRRAAQRGDGRDPSPTGQGQPKQGQPRAAVLMQGETFVGQQPAMDSFDPTVPAQPGAGVAADAGDAGGNPAPAEVAAHPRGVVVLVAVQRGRSPSRSAAATAPDRRHRVLDRPDEQAVVPVCSRDEGGQRQPVRVDQRVGCPRWVQCAGRLWIGAGEEGGEVAQEVLRGPVQVLGVAIPWVAVGLAAVPPDPLPYRGQPVDRKASWTGMGIFHRDAHLPTARHRAVCECRLLPAGSVGVGSVGSAWRGEQARHRGCPTSDARGCPVTATRSPVVQRSLTSSPASAPPRRPTTSATRS